MTETDEIEVDLCCDALLDAIEGGGIQVVEVEPGVYAEVIADSTGQRAIQVNYCPFCGTPRVPDLPGEDAGARA